MKKKKISILILVLLAVSFSVTAEITAKDQIDSPPLLENNNGSYSGFAGSLPVPPGAMTPGVPVPPSGAMTPGMPVPPPGTMTPGMPVPPPGAMTPGMSVTPPGTLSTGGYPAAYSIDITQKKVQQVLSTVKEVKQYLKTGKIWLLKGPGGELEIKGGVMYQGAVVSVIEFSPTNGSVLPTDYRPLVYQENISLETIRNQFEKIVNNMQILEGVWYSQPEACWIIPIAYQGVVITTLKIYYDGIHVIPDYNASGEMAYYGS